MESCGVTTISPNGGIAPNAQILKDLWSGDGTRTRDVQLGNLGFGSVFYSGTRASPGVQLMSARAGVHGRNQHETRREAERHAGARNGHGAVFERLAEHFQHIPRGVRGLVPG